MSDAPQVFDGELLTAEAPKQHGKDVVLIGLVTVSPLLALPVGLAWRAFRFAAGI